MKKTLFSLIILSLFFGSCSTDQPITLSFSETNISASGNSNVSNTMTATVTNNSNSQEVISWNFSETTAITGWDYTIKINNVIEATGASGTVQLAESTGSFLLAASASVTIEITVTPNNYLGTGISTISFSENSRALGSITSNYTALSTPAQFSLSKTVDSGTGLASTSSVSYQTIVTNLTNQNLEISWARKIGSQNPSNWFYTTTTDYLCWAPYIETQKYIVAPHDSFDLQAIIHNQSTTGTGQVTHYLYLAPDSANTVQSFVVTHTAN